MAIWHAQAPIAPGSERCVRLAGGGRMEVREGVPLGTGDISFLVDSQLESSGVHPVIRWEAAGRAFRFDLERHNTEIRGHFYAYSGGGWVQGTVAMSGTTGKRIAVRFCSERALVLIDEMQPWGPGGGARLTLTPGSGVPIDWQGLTIGGATSMNPEDVYRGRVAEVAAFDKLLSDESIDACRRASLAANPTDVPQFQPGALDYEGREILLDDYEQLVRWHNAGRLNRSELRAASVLAHLWLLDHRPLLQLASDHYGGMISCPDLRRSDALAQRRIELDTPLWSPETEHEGDWVPLATFRDDLACWLGQSSTVVSWTAFIKFVRNKLGGGHFDPDDRQLWQRQLIQLVRKIEIDGEPWLAATMLTLVRSLILAADGSGLIHLARDG